MNGRLTVSPISTLGRTATPTPREWDQATNPLPRRGEPMPPSVNYHMWAPCNMRCRFCFAPFEDVVATVAPRGHLPREDALRLTRLLAERFRKISFAGGEPTLCAWLPELVYAARSAGATTMLVTNGSRLSEMLPDLRGALDWVAVSVDSASPDTLLHLGRAVAGRRALPPEHYFALADEVRATGIRLKLNTVITRENAGEDMRTFVRRFGPERWKVLRVLSVDGQNTGRVEPLLCPADAFEEFLARHAELECDGITVVAEDNDDMRGSYAMVDPAGRFFDNTSGGHRYSRAILAGGIEAAWSDVEFSMQRFLDRGGAYAFAEGA